MDTDIVKSMLSYSKKANTPAVDIIIDELTPCLIHRESQETYDTVVVPFAADDLPQVAKWNFQWQECFGAKFRNAETYKLMIKGQNRIEGLICLEPDDKFVFVHLVESAPWNIGSKTKEFDGVGAHLFAIACQKSLTLGFDGYVCFDVKTKLMNHYRKTLGAKDIAPQRLYIDMKEAVALVEKYTW